MDQLNRGIKVEGLQLPPGITLTRVDPTRAEQIQRKRDSIERIAIPQTQVPQEQNRPHLIMPSWPAASELQSQSYKDTIQQILNLVHF